MSGAHRKTIAVQPCETPGPTRGEAAAFRACYWAMVSILTGVFAVSVIFGNPVMAAVLVAALLVLADL
jgi:hypothetical protein